MRIATTGKINFYFGPNSPLKAFVAPTMLTTRRRLHGESGSRAPALQKAPAADGSRYIGKNPRPCSLVLCGGFTDSFGVLHEGGKIFVFCKYSIDLVRQNEAFRFDG